MRQLKICYIVHRRGFAMPVKNTLGSESTIFG